MRTPTKMFKQVVTLSIPNYIRENNMDILNPASPYTDTTGVRCSIQDSSGRNSLVNERLAGQRFTRGAFPPNTGATKDSILTITSGANTGLKYRFKGPLKASGGEGHIFVADLENEA